MAPHSSTLAWNPMGGGAWWAAVHGVAKSRTRLSDLAAGVASLLNYNNFWMVMICIF